MKIPVMTLCERCKDQLAAVFIFEAIDEDPEARQCSQCGRTGEFWRYNSYARGNGLTLRERIAGLDTRKDGRARYRPRYGEED